MSAFTLLYSLTLVVAGAGRARELQSSITSSPSASITSSGSASASGSASDTPAPYCLLSVAFNALLNGTSGAVSGYTGSAAFSGPSHAFAGACPWTGDPFPGSGLSHVVAIDLGASTPLGGTLVVDTCSSNANTIIFVGVGCPTSPNSFECVNSGGDDWSGTCATSTDSFVVTNGFASQLLYAIIANKQGLPVNYSFHYAYSPPTPAPSISPAATHTRSLSPSVTKSSSLSFGASPTCTPSTTPSVPPSGSVSPSVAPTVSGSSTGSNLPTPSASPSHTPSPSVSAFCYETLPFNGLLSGSSGVWTGSTVTGAWLGEASLSGAVCTDSCASLNSCASEPFPANNTVPSGHVSLLALDLGADTQLGGTLILDTCTDPMFDSLLFVGSGCPTSARAWDCVVSNDDADLVCSGSRSSAVALAPSTRNVYVLVAGFENAAAPYTLTWSYAPPTSSPSLHATRSSTRSATLSVGATPSRSALPSGTRSVRPSPSLSASGTATPSHSPSGTGTSGLCGVGGSGVLFAATLHGVSGTFGGSTAAGVVAIPYGNCPQQSYDGSIPGAPSVNLVFQSPQQFIAIDLGFTPPLNGTPGTAGFLNVNTCTDPAFDTELFVLASCPVPGDFAASECVLSNDDAVGCGDGTQSNVTLPLLGGVRIYYVMTEGYYRANGTYTLTYGVLPPIASSSPSVSSTPSSSGTPPQSRSATATPSVPLPSASATPTATAATTSSATASWSETGSPTRTPSSSDSGTITGSGTSSGSLTRSPNPTSSSSSTRTPARSPSDSASRTRSALPSPSRPASSSHTRAPTTSRTRSGSATASRTRTESHTESRTGSHTRSESASITRTETHSKTRSRSHSLTSTQSRTRKAK